MSKILDILGELRPEFDFSESQDFFKDGRLDSFDVVMLVSELEEQYSISIDGADIVPENFQNLLEIESLLKTNGSSV